MVPILQDCPLCLVSVCVLGGLAACKMYALVYSTNATNHLILKWMWTISAIALIAVRIHLGVLRRLADVDVITVTIVHKYIQCHSTPPCHPLNPPLPPAPHHPTSNINQDKAAHIVNR